MERTPAIRAITKVWDKAVDEFLDRARELPDELAAWRSCYGGKGDGAIDIDALPEPYLGAISRTSPPAGVFLALNPGKSHAGFQGRDGVFAREIRAHGSYTAWAATWPYFNEPWVRKNGKNRHHETRLQFLRNWTGDSALPRSAMVSFELYPWHSARLTGGLAPDPETVRRFVWSPVAELEAPVFAFGAAWFNVLGRIGMEVAETIGKGGRAYPTRVGSRTIKVFRSPREKLAVIAEKHSGSAGPPSLEETLLMREAIERYL